MNNLMLSETEQLPKVIRRAAIDLLARREHGFVELKRKLALRFPYDLLEQELIRLREQGLQNDARFVESYVYSRKQKGYGPVRIRSELNQKCIDNEVINQYLCEDEDSWTKLACDIRTRKFGDGQPENQKLKAKAVSLSGTTGFQCQSNQ